MNEKKNVLKDKSFDFSIRIVNLYKYLTSTKNEYVLSKQLLRSGTAVGALIREAQNAESKADFIHKLAIAQKECDESIYWIELLFHTEYLSNLEYENINNDAVEILKIVRSIIITTKANSKKS
ncbi:four helix bundle protein [Chryseobacterium ginsenosidimutans]|uniref:four helix bundle protein n=1 Tax=Chryseobacterium ginsenosidimutans TaxID=687846 RepID=UPI00216978CB|nr:four helix bundle protein [Chryseobacterium ginsenosidimutans]MCS3869860.1 four helix bundle protein [Chryseobacterium ginsenosidimutans]